MNVPKGRAGVGKVPTLGFKRPQPGWAREEAFRLTVRALAIALALLAPSAGALPFLGLPASSASPLGPIPSSCVAENGTYACQWVYDTRDHPNMSVQRWEIPAFPKTLATVTVSLEGADGGWGVDIVRLFSFESEGRTRVENQTVSSSQHAADPTRPDFPVTDSTTHVFTATDAIEDAADVANSSVTLLSFSPFATSSEGGALVANDVANSVGTFRIYYSAEPVPIGARHERPAADRSFPQLKGAAHDALRNELDLVASWLDDATLDDGLMDVHLAVAGDLGRIDWNATGSPVPPPVAPPNGIGQTAEVDWYLHFKVQGTQYFVKWVANPRADGATAFRCGLYRTVASATERAQPDSAEILVSSPRCGHDNDTLDAEFPELSIGSPGPGLAFEELSANVDQIYRGPTSHVQSDRLGPARFTFALGGPAVWDRLNGCHFCPTPLPWYKDPLSPDNIPNTLQVGGAGVAGGAFFVGLLLVRRRRAHVTALLREVSDVEEKHERDTRAALLALGRLDSKFADMFHKGKLDASQYQVVSQRVATAATRFALRQGLGMDDGVAGTPRARSVPVLSSEAPLRPNE